MTDSTIILVDTENNEVIRRVRSVDNNSMTYATYKGKSYVFNSIRMESDTPHMTFRENVVNVLAL